MSTQKVAAQQASNRICICNKLLNILTICDTGKATNNLPSYKCVNLATRAQYSDKFLI